MRRIIIAAIAIFFLLRGVATAKPQDAHGFIRDFTDCLYKLKVAADYNVKNAPYKIMLKNFQGQSVSLKEAKGIMEKWLDHKERPLKIAAWYLYGIISVLQTDADKIIGVLNMPMEGTSPGLSNLASEQSDYWNKVYEATGYALWAVIEHEKDKSPGNAIPYILSQKERREAVKYIHKIFEKDFKEYEELVERRDKGLIKEFDLCIPVWSALYFRSMLSAQTYGDIDKIDYFKLN